MGTCEYLLLFQFSWLLGLAIYHMVRKRHAPRPDLVLSVCTPPPPRTLTRPL